MRFHLSLKESAHVDAATAEVRRLHRVFASGDITQRADLSGASGPVRELLASMNEMLDAAAAPTAAFTKSLARMSAEHDRGDIDVVVPAEEFHGDLANAARMVNALVGAHIAVKKTAMACVKQFGEGNFDAPMEQLPGKKAFINDIIEQLAPI
jgi:methyl-accepting chemotaxis protein